MTFKMQRGSILMKSTKAEYDQRVSEVQELLLSGRTRSFIIQYGSKWQVSDRQIDDYISSATKVIKEILLGKLEDNMAIISNNLWELFRFNKSEGNTAECHKILMSLAKLKGLDQQVINHVIDDKRELAHMTDAELERLLETPQDDRH